MPVDNINTVPGVIKSTMSREQINRTAQGWLENRRKENKDKENWLFGKEKVYKQPYSPSSVGSPASIDMSPQTIYFRGR